MNYNVILPFKKGTSTVSSRNSTKYLRHWYLLKIINSWLDYFSSAIAASLFFISEQQKPLAVGSFHDWDFSFNTILWTILRKDAWHSQTLSFDHRAGLTGLNQFGRKIKMCLMAQVVIRNAGPCSLNPCGCCKEKWLLLRRILYQMAWASLSLLSLVYFFSVERERGTVRSLQGVLGWEGTQHHHPWTFLVIV